MAKARKSRNTTPRASVDVATEVIPPSKTESKPSQSVSLWDTEEVSVADTHRLKKTLNEREVQGWRMKACIQKPQGTVLFLFQRS